MTPVTIPQNRRIEQGPNTARLYDLERKRNQAVIHSAVELALVTKNPAEHGDPAFWDDTMPEALLNTLDSFSPSVGIAAAVGYLRDKGLTVPDQEGSAVPVPGGGTVFYSVRDGTIRIHDGVTSPAPG